MSSDSELIRRAKGGDRSAFDELMQRHFIMVRRIVRGFASIEEDVYDLVQETFITAYDRLYQLADPERFVSWLSVIARNECRMWLRSRLSQPTLLPLVEEDGASPAALALKACETMRRRAVREAITDALSALNDQQQRAVRMHYLQGYDYNETAQLLNVPVSVVRGRLDRARKTLRKELKDMANVKDSWELQKRDLDIIRFAAGCVHNDLEHRASSICFTGDGSFACTDTHRLLYYTSSSLYGIPRAIVHADFARTLREDFPELCRGHFTLTGNEAVLKLPGGEDVKGLLVDKPYPNLEPMFATVRQEWEFNVRAQSGHWLQALRMLKLQRENGFITPDDVKNKRLLMVLSPEEARITLRQGHDPLSGHGVGSEMSIWFPAEFSSGGPDLVIAFNSDYLEDAISVLGLSPEEMVELHTNRQLGPILTKPVGAENVWMLTMPMAGTTHRWSNPEEAACPAS